MLNRLANIMFISTVAADVRLSTVYPC